MRIRVPATTANLGCGYDTFGMALGYYNYIECAEAEQATLRIVGLGEKHLPLGDKNLILRAVQTAYDAAGKGPAKLALTAYNNIPLSRGMGSSSSAIVGGLFAANHMLGQPLDLAELLRLATEMEGHPDNVAPALLGGFTVIAQEGRQCVKRIAAPAALRAVLAIPNFTVATKKARAIMPRQVALEDAVYNLSHAAMLALCLAEGDLPGFGLMLNDRLHQPYRFTLVKGAEAVVAAAKAAGALGCVLSGSGPTMIAFHEEDGAATERIGAAMAEAFAAQGVETKIVPLAMDNEGTVVEA